MDRRHLGILAASIYGAGVDAESGCCENPILSDLCHPFYRCKSCGKKVRLVKTVRVRAVVVAEDKE